MYIKLRDLPLYPTTDHVHCSQSLLSLLFAILDDNSVTCIPLIIIVCSHYLFEKPHISYTLELPRSMSDRPGALREHAFCSRCNRRWNPIGRHSRCDNCRRRDAERRATAGPRAVPLRTFCSRCRRPWIPIDHLTCDACRRQGATQVPVRTSRDHSPPPVNTSPSFSFLSCPC